jgi:hypothetical protein
LLYDHNSLAARAETGSKSLGFMNVRFSPWLRAALVVLGWSTASAAFSLGTIFQGQLLPRNINGGGLYSDVLNANPLWLWLFYIGNFAVCVVASMVISEVGKAVISFFLSYTGAALITYFVLALPDYVGIYDPTQVLQESATVFVFTAFFPLLLLVNLSGTVAGIALGERLL